MTILASHTVMLHIGDGGTIETFYEVGGMRLTKLEVSKGLIEKRDVGTGAWRVIAEDAGLQAVRLSGEGIVMSDEADERLRASAFSGEHAHYRLAFGNGDVLAGAFCIRNYNRTANIDEASPCVFSISLESSGEVTYG